MVENGENAPSIADSSMYDQIYEPIITSPNDLHGHIGVKMDVLRNRDAIIQVKLAKYQKTNDYLNISIIIISSILSIYEAFRGKIDNIITDNFVDIGINTVPIILSSVITCIASVVKLKKYQEKTDNIHITREKVSVARCKLKYIQEELLFCKSQENFRRIRQLYFTNAYDFYCDGSSFLDRYIKAKDYKRYGGKVKVRTICCCFNIYEKNFSNKKKNKKRIDDNLPFTSNGPGSAADGSAEDREERRCRGRRRHSGVAADQADQADQAIADTVDPVDPVDPVVADPVDPVVADPADPVVADPSVADPVVADPTVGDPVADPEA